MKAFSLEISWWVFWKLDRFQCYQVNTIESALLIPSPIVWGDTVTRAFYELGEQ